MKCNEIMKRDVECVSPDEPVESAARKMRNENVGFLPVCEDDKQVIGTITDRDITIRLVAEDLPASTPVEEVMSREVIACKPDDDISKAQELMGQHRKSRIMCLDDSGKLVGIISLSDIAQRQDGAQAIHTMRQITQREAHV